MRILVISPHPDDETLGAGGTIVGAKKETHKIYWLNITGISEKYGFAKDVVEEKNKQISEVKNFYGYDGMKDLKLPTTKIDLVSCGEGIGFISEYINLIKPQVILMPDYSDAHSAHRFVFG